MKPIKFKESNVVFAEHQEEYYDLPAYKNSDEQGHVLTCWEFSFREKLRILFGRKLWLSMLTFNQPLTPLHLTTDKPIFTTTDQINEN